MKMQPYIGSYIKGDLGGVKVSNPSLRALPNPLNAIPTTDIKPNLPCPYFFF